MPSFGSIPAHRRAPVRDRVAAAVENAAFDGVASLFDHAPHQLEHPIQRGLSADSAGTWSQHVALHRRAKEACNRCRAAPVRSRSLRQPFRTEAEAGTSPAGCAIDSPPGKTSGATAQRARTPASDEGRDDRDSRAAPSSFRRRRVASDDVKPIIARREVGISRAPGALTGPRQSVCSLRACNEADASGTSGSEPRIGAQTAWYLRSRRPATPPDCDRPRMTLSILDRRRQRVARVSAGRSRRTPRWWQPERPSAAVASETARVAEDRANRPWRRRSPPRPDKTQRRSLVHSWGFTGGSRATRRATFPSSSPRSRDGVARRPSCVSVTKRS